MVKDEIISKLKDQYHDTYTVQILAEYIEEFQMLMGGVRIDIWTHLMRGCIIDYVH